MALLALSQVQQQKQMETPIVVRETRWIFWKRLAQIALNHSLVLDEYLWLLMLNEHFIDYKDFIGEQIELQLAFQSSTL